MDLGGFIRLLEAYRDTRYLFVADGVEHDVRVDRRNPAAEAWLAGRRSTHAGFITADNPRSQRLSEAENAAARLRLAAAVRAHGFDALPHTGASLDGAWSEHGLLVPGMPLDDLLELAESFGQNAVVWFAPGRPARLVPTRILLDAFAEGLD
jgi:hypothetical protein